MSLLCLSVCISSKALDFNASSSIAIPQVLSCLPHPCTSRCFLRWSQTGPCGPNIFTCCSINSLSAQCDCPLAPQPPPHLPPPSQVPRDPETLTPKPLHLLRGTCCHSRRSSIGNTVKNKMIWKKSPFDSSFGWASCYRMKSSYLSLVVGPCPKSSEGEFHKTRFKRLMHVCVP